MFSLLISVFITHFCSYMYVIYFSNIRKETMQRGVDPLGNLVDYLDYLVDYLVDQLTKHYILVDENGDKTKRYYNYIYIIYVK